MIKKNTSEDGVTLLVTLLLMGVLLGVSTSLLNITLKQFQLSGIAYASEIAFQAANAGMECMLYHDLPKVVVDTDVSPFDVNGDGTSVPEESDVSCMGDSSADLESTNSTVKSGEEQLFSFSWGDPEVCSEVSIYKFSEDPLLDGNTDGPSVTVNGEAMRDKSDPDDNQCPEGSVCTVIQSRGYNVGCNDIYSSGRVVEREYTQVY